MDTFFVATPLLVGNIVELDEVNVRHCVQVLRHTKGARVALTDGFGIRAYAEIVACSKHSVSLRVCDKIDYVPPRARVSLAIAGLKNPDRVAWLVEKATEIGVHKIYIMRCARSQKTYTNKTARLRQLCIAAMLQSQRAWLPELYIDTPFVEVVSKYSQARNFIAHCDITLMRTPLHDIARSEEKTLFLIGPEGDFNREEIGFAHTHHYTALSLSPARLRAETAALYVLSYLNSA